MPREPRLRLGLILAALLVAAGAAGAALLWARDPRTGPGDRPSTSTVTRRDFVESLRLTGTVEAVESTTIATPRLTGPNTQSLVITRLVKAGAPVQQGDLIVEFDRQTQISTALDRRAELDDLEQQIRKREAAELAARARDDSEILLAETSVARAKLDTGKREVVSRILAEQYQQALERAEATLTQLRTTYALKRKAAEADLAILKIRRDRADNAMRQAEGNAERMAVRAPIDGMAVIRTVWKSNTMSEVQEGEEVRAGVPVVDIVNPEAMRVRARVNQADVSELRVGQPVRVGLDAYPDLAFDGRIAQISPIGVVSTLSPRVRIFLVLVDIDGSHPNLMPDLTAALDVEIARVPNVLVVPRDALRRDGEATFARVLQGGSSSEQRVEVGSLSAHEAVVTSGLAEGAVVARHVSARGSR
ncbi:MAG TPA: efflux RND transporter periplasmic adaptor subunit [Vicinamibacterales bacterium]|nr:efflux RND transporter periplasmic adaptor subunit [Vicinamibacterales bacterium]